MSQNTITKTRLERCLDERATVTKLREDTIAAAESREDQKGLTEPERELVESYRKRAAELDAEITQLHDDIENEEKAAKANQLIRAHLAGTGDGVEVDGDGVKYRTFAAYARDALITKHGETFEQIARLAGGEKAVEAARERLYRVSNHTLSSHVEGLQPEQHIAQILEVIDTDRPLVASAQRYTLTRGRLQFPRVTSRPVVAAQGNEKTEGGDTRLAVEMVDTTATVYIGGGNLSWQAIEWSTPDALQLWFDLAGADYALKTEQDAGEIVQSAAAANLIADQLTGDGTDEFADWILALTEGAAEVYANSGAMANTVYLAPDMFYFAAGVTSDAGAPLINAGSLNIGSQSGTLAGMRVVVSRGLDAGVAVVGDSRALLVAENAGAPVQLRAVEPAIGGLEVGVIGAFEAVAYDDSRFALIGTAS